MIRRLLLILLAALVFAAPARADDIAVAGRSVVRVVAWAVDGLVLLLPVALWSAWFTPGHRRVGDWAAGTYVVRHRARARAPSSRGTTMSG